VLRRFVVLVESLPDDLLEQIFHRDKTRRAAVLVEDDRHVFLETLEISEDAFNLACSGHDMERPHDGSQREVGRRGA
jgi:hypothetical protein